MDLHRAVHGFGERVGAYWDLFQWDDAEPKLIHTLFGPRLAVVGNHFLGNCAQTGNQLAQAIDRKLHAVFHQRIVTCSTVYAVRAWQWDEEKETLYFEVQQPGGIVHRFRTRFKSQLDLAARDLQSAAATQLQKDTLAWLNGWKP